MYTPPGMGNSHLVPLCPPAGPPLAPFPSNAAISDEARCEGREGEVRDNVRDEEEEDVVSEADTANVDGPQAMDRTLRKGRDMPC